jgi:putative transposase
MSTTDIRPGDRRVGPAHDPEECVDAHLERFTRSLEEECLDRMIFFGEAPRRKAATGFLAHFHGERNHQGLGNRAIEGGEAIDRTSGPVQRRKRLDPQKS